MPVRRRFPFLDRQSSLRQPLTELPADRHGGVGAIHSLKINKKIPANVVNVNFRGHPDVDYVNNIREL